MGRYSGHDEDKAMRMKGFPNDVTKVNDYYRALRRDELAEILEDVDKVIGPNAMPELYSAGVIALMISHVSFDA